ncbi:MAG: type II CAAX endopeptidase family protein [Candidatus Nanoarchaeia archaeon]|jgi:membrane protease YdiL (CAAX protease family)
MSFIALNLLINGSTNWLFELIMGFLFFQVIPTAVSIIIAPFTNPGMLWIVTPLLISMTLMQLYFGRHRQEELGWNTAFGNSIALIFVSINLLQFISNQYGFSALNPFAPVTNKLYLVIGLALVSVAQLIINYFHLISKKIAFFINSSIPTNMTAYVAIVLVYTSTGLSWVTIAAALLILAVFILLFNFIKGLVPMSKEAVSYLNVKKTRDAEHKALLAKKELRQSRAADAKLTDSLITLGFVVGVIGLLAVIRSFFVLPVWISPLVQGASFTLITLLILRWRGLDLFNLNFDGEWREVLVGLGLGLLLIVIITGLIDALWLIIPSINKSVLLLHVNDFISINPLINIAVIGLLLPFGCELLFRGIILRSLKSHMNTISALIIQSLLFAFISFAFSLFIGFVDSFSLFSIPIFFVSGLLLGLFRDKWGLESAITAHMTFNLIGLLLLFF